MRFLLAVVLSVRALAQQPVFTFPEEILQGYAGKLEVSRVPQGANWTIQWLDNTIPLFPDGPERAYALLPVPVMRSPGDFPVQVVDQVDGVISASKIRVVDAQYLEQDIVVTRQMRRVRVSDFEKRKMAEFRKRNTPKRHWNEIMLKPVPECINSPFGVKRLHNGQPSGRYHGGLDMRSPKGRVVKAGSAGIVRISRMFPGQGGTIGIDHGQGVKTLYLHLSRLSVREGVQVKRGQPVGRVGATGFATGSHLHWVVSVHGVQVNPLQWLEKADTASCK